MRAIIAGSGALPRLLLEAEIAYVVQFKGVVIDRHKAPPIKARFEQLGKLFDDLRAKEVTEVCLAGAMGRPTLDPVAFDPFTAAKMPMLMAAMGQGDDALLRAIVSVIEGEGFRVVAAHEIRPDLVAQAGVIAGKPMGESDAARGREVLAALASLDVGQGVVVGRGQVLGIETLQGTEAMLRFVAETAPGSGGVFVKRPKAGQTLKVDMPAIGPDTIRQAAAAGLKGIEVEPGKVLLIDRAAIEAACAETGVSLWAGP
ncbi:UDP-2,3-diacylglucosamine diphosphatase LpxI [Rhodobacterales bacterium HKCCE4037]|nr:UDP-2,3-diacylglucosamine diphosphatase LpxI [Rhodobacterales bacterium HKCCE4037]